MLNSRVLPRNLASWLSAPCLTYSWLLPCVCQKDASAAKALLPQNSTDPMAQWDGSGGHKRLQATFLHPLSSRGWSRDQLLSAWPIHVATESRSLRDCLTHSCSQVIQSSPQQLLQTQKGS